jgi:hypothetical protein
LTVTGSEIANRVYLRVHSKQVLVSSYQATVSGLLTIPRLFDGVVVVPHMAEQEENPTACTLVMEDHVVAGFKPRKVFVACKPRAFKSSSFLQV